MKAIATYCMPDTVPTTALTHSNLHPKSVGQTFLLCLSYRCRHGKTESIRQSKNKQHSLMLTMVGAKGWLLPWVLPATPSVLLVCFVYVSPFLALPRVWVSSLHPTLPLAPLLHVIWFGRNQDSSHRLAKPHTPSASFKPPLPGSCPSTAMSSTSICPTGVSKAGWF